MEAFLPVLVSVLLSATMVVSLRHFVTAGSRVEIDNGHGFAFLIASFVMIFITSVLGLVYGLALMLALMSFEAGQVMAYRMLGHKETRFRLLPFANPRGISDEPLSNDSDGFFVALMGPAFGIAPTIISASLYAATIGTLPTAAEGFRVIAVTMASFNLILLLPFVPMNGGRCVRILASNLWPVLAPAATVFAASALFVSGLKNGSPALMIIAAAGLHSLAWGKGMATGTMPKRTSAIALAAYSFVFATFYTCASWLSGDLF